MEYYPRISIITPSFNQGEFIETTILSIIEQNYPNVEHIVIDAGSTDNTVDILKKYDNHIKWISEKDEGQSDAINKGLEMATGDIFNWINSDDYLEKNSLFIIAEAYKKKQFDVLCGKLIIFDNDTKGIIKKYSMGIEKTAESTVYHTYMCQPATFYKMDIVKQLGGINKQLHYVMDVELWHRYLLKYGLNNITQTDNVLAYFRSHDMSKSIAQNNKFIIELDNVKHSLMKYMECPDFVRKYANEKYDNSMNLNIDWAVGKDFNTIAYIAMECSHIAKKAYCDQDYKLFKKCIRYIIGKTGFMYVDNELKKLILKVFLINGSLLNSIRKIKNN